jgi:hypothetical protein
MAEVKDILQEYVATANNPQYKSDWNIINSKFPELKGYDTKLLQEYVATANNPQYKSDFKTINSKFPELFSQKQTSTKGVGVLKYTTQDLGFNSSMFKIPTFNNTATTKTPITTKKPIGIPTKEQQITGDYLIDNGQKGFADKSILGQGTTVSEQPEIAQQENPYLVDVTDKSSDNTVVLDKGITPVSKLSIVNTLSTEELLNTDKDQLKYFLNKDKTAEELDFEIQSNSNNNAQAYNGEMSIYDAQIRALNDRGKSYESVLKSKFGEDFFTDIAKQNTQIQAEAQQFGLYSTKRKSEYDKLVLELKDIEKQITENQLPKEQAEPMYNAKLAQIQAIEKDIDGRREEILKKQEGINSKVQDEDFTTYLNINDKINQLTNDANSEISKPEFAEYRKLLDEGDKAQAKKDAMKKAYQSKGILGKASDIMGALSQLSPVVMAENLITGESDKTFTGAKVADEGDKLLGRTLKALASVPKMLDILNPIGDENKYDVFDKMFDQAIYASKKRDILNPTATDVQRDIIQKYADVDGYKVMLDENGKPKNDVRDDKFRNINDKTKKEITDKYNENPTAYKTESDFSFSTLITKATPTILDMGTMMATAALTGGATGLVAGAGTAGTVSTATTIGVSAAQMYGDMYESGLTAGLTPQEANDFATLTSIMTGMVTLVNPMEANIVKGTASKSIGKFISNNISKADVQLIRSGEMSIGQYAKRMAKEGVKNTFGENLEELVLEPAVQRATETYYNTKAQKNGQQGFEDLNKPFFDTKQTIETAMITTMASLLMTPIEVANSVPEQRKIALQNALDNPQQFVDMRQKMLADGDIEQGKFDYEVKAFEEISKQYNSVKPTIKEDLHDDLAELLLKKYTLKNTMSQVNDEVLNKKNQLLLDDINKRLEEVADGTYNKGKEKALSNIANPNTLIEEDKIATYNGAEVTILDDLADGEVVINTNNPEIGEDGIITVEKSALTDVRNKPKGVEPVQITSAVININGKKYEGKNHAEAILKAQADGQDISQVDRQAEGLFKLSDGTIINREQAKEQFGQDRSELIIPQDEASNQANVEYKRIQDEQENPITPVEPINAGQEQNNVTGIQQTPENDNGVQQGDGQNVSNGKEVQQNEQEIKPIRQLGNGSNVYYETEKHRVNDFGNKVLLNIGEKDSQLPASNIEFDNANDAVIIAERIQRDYPNGVPPALLVDKYVDNLKKELLTKKPNAIIDEIKSKNLTHVKGKNMGENQALGTFVSTEKGNRYETKDNKAERVEVDIKNPLVVENGDYGLVDKRQEVLNANKDKFDEFDTVDYQKLPDGRVTLDNLNDKGIKKLAELTTNELKAQGYDGIYFRESKTQEGELVVFDKEKVKFKGEQKSYVDEVQPKAEPQKKAEQVSSEQKLKNDKHDRLVGLMREYNSTPTNKKTRKSEIRQKIQKLASDLGYTVKGKLGDKIDVLNEKGKKIRKINIAPTEVSVSPDIIAKVKEIAQSWFEWNGNDTDYHIDASQLGLTWQEIRRAKADIDAGKTESTNINRVANAINEYGSMESLPLVRGFGGNYERIDVTGEDLFWAQKANETTDFLSEYDNVSESELQSLSNISESDEKEFKQYSDLYAKFVNEDGSINWEEALKYEQANGTTETTTDKSGERQGSSADISSSENSQQVKEEKDLDLQSTDKSFTPISESVFTKLIDKLKKAFPNVKVELFGKNNFENAKKELQDKGIAITDVKTKDGTIYGFKTPDGKVFINTDNLNANTPIHEFGHIWQSVFPEGFKRGIELLKLSPQGRALIAEIQKNPAYKGKSIAEIQAEALVTAIGNKGEQLFNGNPTMLKRFKEWLSDFFKTIGDKLGIKNLSADDKFNMFTKKVVGELLGGKILNSKIGTQKSSEKTITFQGENIKVKEINGGAEVVNGFYSPLEKIIGETKFDKLPAKQWLDKFGKGDEAKWTGLTDWLSSQQGSVSKAEIQQYLKENRIEVVEVVKDDGELKIRRNNVTSVDEDETSWYVNFDNDGRIEVYKDDSDGKEDAIDIAIDEINDNIRNMSSDEKKEAFRNQTKFSDYQLEGEKSNYKEVLVTMPEKEIKGEPYHVVRDKYLKPALEKLGLNDSEGALRRMKIYDEQGRSEEFKNDKDYPEAIEALDALKKGGYSEALNKYYSGFKYNSELDTQRKKTFKSSHFDEPNILVHLRMNTRTDVNGNKVLFLEEVQSDWGQSGKKEGFKEPSFEWDTQLGKDAVVVLKKMNETAGFSDWKGLATAMAKSNDILNDFQVPYDNKDLMLKWHKAVNQERKTPQAPFVTDTNAWTKLGLKVALKEAVKQGVDKIAWTTGEQQNERYDLSKQINAASASKNNDGTYQLIVEDKQGQEIEPYSRSGKKVTPQEMESIVGKDLTQKLIEGADRNKGREWKKNMKENPEFHTVRGVDLKIGGKGMKGFYGSPTEGSLGIVGNVAKSLFKQEPKAIEVKLSDSSPSNEVYFNDWEVTGYIGKFPQWKAELDDITYEIGTSDGIKYTLWRGEEKVGVYNSVKQAQEAASGTETGGTSTQYSIDITPELKEMAEFGQPLFQIVNNPSKEEIGKAYDVAQAYLEATDFNFDTDQRDAFIEEIKQNPALKAMFTTSQLEKIYEALPLSATDKVKIKYKLLVYNLKADNSANKAGLKQQQKQMVADITALIKGNLGGITGKQAEKLINLATTAVEKNSTVRLGKIINQIANLADQRTYQKAKTLYEVIKARSKRKGGVQSGKLTGVLQDFATINPLDVSDIAKYVELAEKVKQASNVVKQPTDAESTLVYDEVQAYVKAQQDEINSNAINDIVEDDAMTFFTVLDNKTKAKFGDDKTFDDLNEPQQREVFESITKDDIKKYGLTDEERDMVEAFKEIKTEQKRQDFITATYNKIGELKDLLANSVGVITQSPAEKEITDALLNVKLDDMTATEMARVLKLINGITQNNDYSGGGAFVAQQKAVEVNSKMNTLKSEIGEFRKLSEGGSKFRNFQQISVAMAKGKKLGAKLMEASGINNLMRGIAKTKTYSHNLQKAFKAEKFKSSVFEPISQMRQSIYAAVIQTKIGDDIKEAEHIARWKRIIEKNIENLRTINKEGYKEQADLLQKALDEVIGGRQQLKDIADNMSKIDSEGKRVVQFFTDNHAEQKPRFRENSLLFHNKEIEEYNSYTKLSITSLTGDTVRDTGEKLMNDARSTGITKKKSKSMIDRANYESLNDNTGLDFNFINRQMKALGDNEYDINTSADITTLANAFNSDNKQLRELLGAKNFDLLKKRLQTIVGTSKYEETTIVDDLLNEATKISRTIALGSITQVLKQSTVLMSTYLNSAGKGNIKGLDFTMLFGNKRQKENLQKLFAQSEIGARRAEGAGGYYDNTTIKKNISDGNAKKILKAIGKGRDFFSDLSMYPLRSFDILAADISWITFYKKYLRDNNLAFDENNEFKNPNKEAMAYAETMVQTAQGANTEAGQAEVWGSAKGLTQLALPFMSFAVQAKARLVDNTMNIANGDDRIEAGRDIGAYITEQIAFNAVKLGIGTFVATQLIPALLKELGLGDDDEEKETEAEKEKAELEKLRKAEQIKSSFVNNILQDLVYGTMPMVDNMATKPAINFLYNHIFKTNTGIIPNYNRSTDFNILSGGTVGVGYNQLLNLKDDINIITDNNAFGDYKSQSQVSVFTYKGKDYTIVHNGRYTRRDMFFNNVKGRMDVSNSTVPADVLKAFIENPSDFKLKEELRKTSSSQDGDLSLSLTDEQKTYAKIMLMADLLTFYGINETVFNQINNKVRGEMKKQIIKK